MALLARSLQVRGKRTNERTHERTNGDFSFLFCSQASKDGLPPAGAVRELRRDTGEEWRQLYT
eukprot:SAG22_NODE_1289_length_4854_cov_2.059937_3_plen_63_part_00